MSLIVQKFGGSSVADPDRIRRCAQRAFDRAREGHQVVVVVSAMGKTTDNLINLANEITDGPPKREMDQLMAAGEQISIALMAIALETLGQPAVSLTGQQARILTESAHTKARIRQIDPGAMRQHLDAGRAVVVAGFQGVTYDADGTAHVTTLGRGGSDTTAVALAAALKADECEIFTDVDGVYTADPRIVPNARKIERISYEAILELASLGAKVMATRSIFFGAKYNVPIHVRHSMLPDTGTMIVPESHDMEQEMVTGLALKTNLGRVTLMGLPARADVQSRIFASVSAAGINVDDIIQSGGGAGGAADGSTSVSFTVDHADLVDIKSVCDRIVRELGQGQVRIDLGLCKVSAVGVGMRSHTGVAAKMFDAMARASVNGSQGIPIQNITTSEIKISVILAKEHGEAAMRAIHEAFGLGR